MAERSLEGNVGSVLRRSPLLSSLFLGTSVLATLWSSAALFSHNGGFLVAVCGVPIVSGDDGQQGLRDRVHVRRVRCGADVRLSGH